MKITRATAHGDKLKALLINAKLPIADRKQVELAIEKYEEWIRKLNNIKRERENILISMNVSLKKKPMRKM